MSEDRGIIDIDHRDLMALVEIADRMARALDGTAPATVQLYHEKRARLSVAGVIGP